MAEHAVDQDEDQGLVARWRQTQPVRLWLYGATAPALAVLVAYGLLTDQRVALWLALAQAVLIPAGTELARGFAVSPATARAAVQQATVESDTRSGRPDHWAARHVLIRYRIPS